MARINKDSQELAKAILESKGVIYEEWLNNQHLNVITGNTKMLQEGLEAREVINKK